MQETWMFHTHWAHVCILSRWKYGWKVAENNCWVNYFSVGWEEQGRSVWVRVGAGDGAGILCGFCFRTISNGLLCSSDDRARQTLQVQVCRQGWVSLGQPGDWRRWDWPHCWLQSFAQVDGNSNHRRPSKLKRLSAPSPPALGPTAAFSISRTSKTYSGWRQTPRRGCPPLGVCVCVCIYIHVRTQHCHPVAS